METGDISEAVSNSDSKLRCFQLVGVRTSVMQWWKMSGFIGGKPLRPSSKGEPQRFRIDFHNWPETSL